MRNKTLLVLALVAFVSFGFFACQKKEEAPTVETAEVEAPPVEAPAVATPEEAGPEPIAPPADVAKLQMLDGLAYTIDVVGWDNPFAATMCGRVLDDIAILSGVAEGEEKETLAAVELDLRAVKSKLDDVVANKGTLTQEELDSIKETLKSADAKLAKLYGYAPTRRLTEAEGDKLKEGHRMREEKEKEGGDLKKEKLKEGGDELKRKKAEGEEEGK
ncbi:MAG: hypothetical protein PVH29_05660 [Candidatus Zixiibacteriota bacterium]|jgi:hypothetical protein